MTKLAGLLILLAAFLFVLLAAETEASGSVAAAAEIQLQGRGVDRMYGVSEGSLDPQDCAPRCTRRCSATSYKKPCMFFCQKCCAKCLCVPPGAYGNKQVCPCYNNRKTKRGGPKCP